ncbi:MAG: hypothetical protein FJY67_11715, partial [Calditrichaeota bacterium]|nr:hypothetical protein [Calditrichota bacterium]
MNMSSSRILTLFTGALLTAAFTNPALAENWALQFDGQNDLVDAGPCQEIRQPQNNFTIECWFRTQAAQGEQVLITNRHQDDGSGFPSITIRNGRINFCVDEQGQRQDIQGPQVNNNQWHHVAGTIDQRRWVLYLDGENVGQLDQGINRRASNYNLHFGHHGAWNVYYNGAIDEIRIWLVTRTQQQIRDNMNVSLQGNEQGLYGYWTFDEGQGQVVNDRSGNGRNGVLGANNQQGNDDPQWIRSEAPVFGGTLSLEPAGIEFLPIIRGRTRQIALSLVNTSEEQDERFRVAFEFTYPDGEPGWLDIEPMNGAVDPGDTLTITVTADAENLDPGEYNTLVRFSSNASNLRRRDMPVGIIVSNGGGRIFGQVTDAANGRPIPGCWIVTQHGFVAQADDEGRYDFPQQPALRQRLTVRVDDYLPMTQEVDLEDGEDVELDFALLHSRLVPDPDAVVRSIA